MLMALLWAIFSFMLWGLAAQHGSIAQQHLIPHTNRVNVTGMLYCLIKGNDNLSGIVFLKPRVGFRRVLNIYDIAHDKPRPCLAWRDKTDKLRTKSNRIRRPCFPLEFAEKEVRQREVDVSTHGGGTRCSFCIAGFLDLEDYPSNAMIGEMLEDQMKAAPPSLGLFVWRSISIDERIAWLVSYLH